MKNKETIKADPQVSGGQTQTSKQAPAMFAAQETALKGVTTVSRLAVNNSAASLAATALFEARNTARN